MGEYILYRREKIPIITLPKGTLLFRFSEHPIHDLRGMKLKDGSFCLTPNYNVFFYPDPFTNRASLPQFSSHENIHVYITNVPIQIVLLIKPSRYTRGHRYSRRAFIKKCSRTRKYCLPNRARAADACFTDTIVKKYPQIVGMMGIAHKDAAMLQRKLDTNTSTQRNREFMHFAEDSNGAYSVPEIVLHPLQQRPSKPVITHDEPLDLNYSLLKDIHVSDSSLRSFMKRHAVYNPGTYTYVYKA